MSTTTEFEEQLLAMDIGVGERGLMAGAAYKLRRYYTRGTGDPQAHDLALNNPLQVDALIRNNMLDAFNAITGIEPEPVQDPALESLDPVSAPNIGTVTLTAIGTGFHEGSLININAGDVPTAFESDTRLSAELTVDAIPPDAYPVIVRTGDHDTAPLDFTITQYVPPAPVLDSITPETAAVGDVITLNAFGANYTSESKIEANSITFPTTRVSATQLSAPINLASFTPGAFDVIVHTGAHSTPPQVFTITEAEESPE